MRQYLSEHRNQYLIRELVVFLQIVHSFTQVHLPDDLDDLSVPLFAPIFPLSLRVHSYNVCCKSWVAGSTMRACRRPVVARVSECKYCSNSSAQVKSTE